MQNRFSGCASKNTREPFYRQKREEQHETAALMARQQMQTYNDSADTVSLMVPTIHPTPDVHSTSSLTKTCLLDALLHNPLRTEMPSETFTNNYRNQKTNPRRRSQRPIVHVPSRADHLLIVVTKTLKSALPKTFLRPLEIKRIQKHHQTSSNVMMNRRRRRQPQTAAATARRGTAGARPRHTQHSTC